MKTRYEDIDIKRNLKVYLSFLKKYKLFFGIVLFCVLINESVSVTEKFLFKILIDRGSQYAADVININLFVKIAAILGFVYLSILGVKVIFKWITYHFINLLETNLIIDIKRYYFNHIIGLSHGFHVSNKTGSLISRISRGSTAVERMTDTLFFNFAPLIFQLIVASTSIIYFDVLPSIIMIITIVTFIVVNMYFQKRQTKANYLANQATDIERANIADIMTNIDAIKYFGKGDMIRGKFAKLSDNTKKATLKHWNYWRIHEATQSLIIGIGTFFIIFTTLKSFIAGNITTGTLAFVYAIYVSILGSMFSFTGGVREFYRVMVDFEDLFQYGRIDNDIKNKENAVPCKINNGEIEFRDVSFNYGKRKIFDNLTLNVKKNEKIALVGHSGSGKTTLVKLLYRLYDVKKGTIKIDGKDIRDFEQESLRGELSIVPQEGILFDDTIYNNIHFSNPSASRKEVFSAIKFAQLDDFIKKLPYKEDTIVGERGVKLSGGEKQRVSIARAILADKRILLLDEATSSLDSKTEYQIQKDLWRLMEGRTTIIIAHRLSTVMRANKIVVMEKGKIVQIGSHNELIRKPGLYKQLWNLQKGGYLGE